MNAQQQQPQQQINRGTGAGGAQTNVNGLPYEESTDLSRFINMTTHRFGRGRNDFYNAFELNGISFKKFTKGGLRNYLLSYFNSAVERSLQPDEAFIIENEKKMFILEKKFQQSSGTVDEKIQTGIFKREFYEEQYPDWNITYAYTLSDWFKQNRYAPEMRHCQKYNIHVFFGKDDDYADNIKEWLTT